jgi:PAS domain S-box-containing protein
LQEVDDRIRDVNDGTISTAGKGASGTATGFRRGRELRYTLGFIVLLAILYLAHLYSYNLFHSLAELFSIAVAFAVFAIAWNSRHIAKNDFLLFLGIALAFVAVNDTLHLLAYKGMGVFPGATTDLPTQLWLTGRYEFTLALLIAPFLIAASARRLRVAVAAFAAVWAALLLSLFAWDVFPHAYVEGQGLTEFKKVSEYVVCALLLVALGLLYRRRSEFEHRILWLLSGAIMATIASELAFTLYTDPAGVLNLAGHFLKIIAFFLLYLAIVERSLVAPYSLLFRGLREREQDLERSEREFRSAFEQAAVGMAQVTPGGAFRLVNRRLAELLGYDLLQLRRMRVSDILHSDERDFERTLLSGHLEGRKRTEQREVRLVRRDGATIRTRVTVSMVFDALDAFDHALLVVEDITEQKRIEQEREELVARLDGVGQVTEAAMQSLEIHELMDAVLAKLIPLMNAQAAVILLMRGDRLFAVSGQGLGEVLREDFNVSLGEGVAGLVAITREPLFVEDVQNDPRISSPLLRSEGVRSLVAVPLLKGDELLGVLHVDWKRTIALTAADLRFLELLADRVAVAIFNADLYRQQKEVAEVLQREMLALPDELPGIRFGHAYRSASEGAHVGGDFYDVFSVDGHQQAWLVMADVSGHGIEAATTAALIREVTRAYVLETTEPSSVLEKVNSAVVQRLAFRLYATMFLGRLDLETGALRYCSAGHPPAFVVRADRQVGELISRSLPVGAFRDSRYSTAQVMMGTGELLALYTDGVTEARSGNEFFGEARLLEVFRRAEAAESLPHEVLAAVAEFSGGRLADDLAVLCVSRAATPGR